MLKTCLFGGALFAAGLHAHAATFVFHDADPSGAYESYALSKVLGGDFDVAVAPGALNTSSSTDSAYHDAFGELTVWTTQTSNTLGAYGYWDGGGSYGFSYGYNRVAQFFSVSEDAQLLIEWDVTGTDAYVYAELIDIDGGGIFQFDGLSGDPLAGSATINLAAGKTYLAYFGLDHWFFPYFRVGGETQFITMTLLPAATTIPLPSAAGMGALAGLAVFRRGRR
jgi:hypothetical protein